MFALIASSMSSFFLPGLFTSLVTNGMNLKDNAKGKFIETFGRQKHLANLKLFEVSFRGSQQKHFDELPLEIRYCFI
ncbi:CLUMA_CG007537, isoform A [Clunio marinus]|uniref:CLUMA_CG007537, isoform A n=1 Tax=Clunio marinus TaxID=568069 RepID=A0A1J1I335_9DIPT|nr:CLUMA_CG007537, isoform A [Clunio marinus]